MSICPVASRTGFTSSDNSARKRCPGRRTVKSEEALCPTSCFHCWPPAWSDRRDRQRRPARDGSERAHRRRDDSGRPLSAKAIDGRQFRSVKNRRRDLDQEGLRRHRQFLQQRKKAINHLAVCTENLNPGVVVAKSTQDGA